MNVFGLDNRVIFMLRYCNIGIVMDQGALKLELEERSGTYFFMPENVSVKMGKGYIRCQL